MKKAVKNISFRKEMKEFGRGIRDKPEAVHFVAFPARKNGSYFRIGLHQVYKDIQQVPDMVYAFYRNAYGSLLKTVLKRRKQMESF